MWDSICHVPPLYRAKCVQCVLRCEVLTELLLLRINLAGCDVVSLGQPYQKAHLPYFEHQQPCVTSRTVATGKGTVHPTIGHEGSEVK